MPVLNLCNEQTGGRPALLYPPPRAGAACHYTATVQCLRSQRDPSLCNSRADHTVEPGRQSKTREIEARRDLTYVDDAVRGAVRLMKCDGAVGKVVNLGSGEDWSVEELARLLGNLLGWKRIDITIDKARLRPLDVNRLCCDNTRIRQMIGWKPEISLVDGLRKTIEWHERNNRSWIWETKMGPEEGIWQDGRGRADLTLANEVNPSSRLEKRNRTTLD